MERIKRELNRYEDLMHQNEREIAERKFRERFMNKQFYLTNSQLSTENIQFKQERLYFEREIADKVRNNNFLNEEIKQLKFQLDKEREQKIAFLEQLQKQDQQIFDLQEQIKLISIEGSKKEQTIGELIKELEKKSNAQKIEKQEQQVSTKKQVEEEINKFKNELQYKFAQKEKKYREYIEKLKQNQKSGEELTEVAMSQSHQSSKSKWVNQSNILKSQDDLWNKIMGLLQVNSVNECFQKVEELFNYKSLVVELQHLLANVSEDVMQYPEVVVQIVNGLLEFHQQQGISNEFYEKIVKQIQFCLNVEDPNEVASNLAQRIVVNEGYSRIVDKIRRHLRIKGNDLGQMELQIYQQLGIENRQ